MTAVPGIAPELLIEVRGLLSQFGERVIHENLDLDVVRGEVLGVVGGSGTGKTVLLNTIIGLKQPEAGSIRIFGHDTGDMTKEQAAEHLARLRHDRHREVAAHAQLRQWRAVGHQRRMLRIARDVVAAHRRPVPDERAEQVGRR